MKKGLVIVLAVLGLLVASVGGCAIYVMGTYNNLIRQEEGIKAVHDDMKNVHASIYNNLKSQGLTVEKYGDLVIQSIEVAMSGRYGKTGSQAAFQWIQEQNPQIDAEIFKKLQTVIEASYNKFEAAQRTKIDRIRIYQTDLRTFPGSLIASSFGFPRINMEEYGKIITTAETKKTFETGEVETIDPFSKKQPEKQP